MSGVPGYVGKVMSDKKIIFNSYQRCKAEIEIIGAILLLPLKPVIFESSKFLVVFSD